MTGPSPDGSDRHSVFLVPANTQMTFKLYNPTTKKTVWRSVNSGGFSPGKDRRSCKSNEFVRPNSARRVMGAFADW